MLNYFEKHCEIPRSKHSDRNLWSFHKLIQVNRHHQRWVISVKMILIYYPISYDFDDN